MKLLSFLKEFPKSNIIFLVVIPTFFILIFGWIIYSVIYSILYPPYPWETESYPNPMKNFTGCNMPNPSYFCDPDDIFGDTYREKLELKLENIKNVTEKPLNTSRNFCDRKSVTIGVAIARKYKNDDLKAFANSTLKKWNLDPECKKSILIVLLLRYNYGKLEMAFDKNVPISECGYWKLYYSYGSGYNGTYRSYNTLNTLLDSISDNVISEEEKHTNCSKFEAWLRYILITFFIFAIIIVICCAIICFRTQHVRLPELNCFNA